jgi:hypothetical protein
MLDTTLGPKLDPASRALNLKPPFSVFLVESLETCDFTHAETFL